MPEIGPTLREARMRARIDISEVETRTKIRAKYLRALENEEWDLLPGPVYVKSFLRTYGDYLGLDSRLLVDDFKRRYERPSDHELRPIASLGRERERKIRTGPLLPSWIVIGLVLVAIVVALWALGNSNSPSTPSAGTHHPTTQPHRGPAHHAVTTPAVTKPTTVKLQLVPTSTVYVCLVDGAGKVLIPGKIFTAGETIPTETASKLLLTLGNASVQMRINGSPVHVAPSATSIGFLIKPSGSSPLPGPKQPRCA
jgi:helix-turn-helix protein